MKKIITGILFFVSTIGFSQVNSPWTQYYQVPYLQNPAFSGIEKYTDVKLGFKHQWSSFNGAPKDYFLGINHALGVNESAAADTIADESTGSRRMGLSGYLAISDYNFTKALQTGVSYAVHIPVSSRYTISFGIAATYGNTRADLDELVVRDKQDAVYVNLMNAGGALNYFGLDAGAVFYSDRFYAGYSAVRLARSRMQSEVTGNGEFSLRHTMLMSYSHSLNDDWEIQTAAMMAMEGGLDELYNFNVKARYKGMVWSGLGFSPKRSVSLMAGYRLNNRLTLSYNYDLNIGKVNMVSSGSHEVMLGIMPFNKSGRTAFLW